MKISKLCSAALWKDSFLYAVSGIAAVETICGIASFDIASAFCINEWYEKALMILIVFVSLWIVTAGVKAIIANRSVTLKLKGVTVRIAEGDIFKSADWKVIPFNEFFDTAVDDVVVARNSLNGEFICRLEDKEELNESIRNAGDLPWLKRSVKHDRVCYPLGRIIPYHDYMLLAFSHFENSQSVLSHDDYETCLRTMWHEISRVYANKPITIPLLGGGITRISDKNEFQLLRCILCTLKTSNAQIYQPVTVVLKREVLDKINLYDLKKLF